VNGGGTMSYGRIMCILENRFDVINNLGNGKMPLTKWMRDMIPHKLHNGKLCRYDGSHMKEFGVNVGVTLGLEDPYMTTIIIPLRLYRQQIVTDTWRNTVTRYMRGFIEMTGVRSETVWSESILVEPEIVIEEVKEVKQPEQIKQPETIDSISLRLRFIDEMLDMGQTEVARVEFIKIKDELGKKLKKQYKRKFKK